MNRAIFLKARNDAFAVVGVPAWVTTKDTGEIVPTRAFVVLPGGEHDGIAPRSTDSAWVDLPDGVAQAGDCLSYVDTADLLPRAYVLTGRPDRGQVGLRVRWVGLRLAVPEDLVVPLGTYPSVHWTGSDWVVRP